MDIIEIIARELSDQDRSSYDDQSEIERQEYTDRAKGIIEALAQKRLYITTIPDNV